jgi:hypothetical protein
MSPDAPIWQIALVAAGSGLIAMAMRELSKRPLFKRAVNFLMFTILLWMILMTVDLVVAVMRGTLLTSPDRPMWSLLALAGVVTLAGQSLIAWRKSKRRAEPIIEPSLPGPGHSLVPKSQAVLPYEQQKKLVQQ